ncbi:hypothetical protein MIR68_010403 [Amoeboaphelidium protococcarum]|nr:hypothetical protein MIR68_010403 [Amoeboaphelidium protococcarum]
MASLSLLHSKLVFKSIAWRLKEMLTSQHNLISRNCPLELLQLNSNVEQRLRNQLLILPSVQLNDVIRRLQIRLPQTIYRKSDKVSMINESLLDSLSDLKGISGVELQKDQSRRILVSVDLGLQNLSYSLCSFTPRDVCISFHDTCLKSNKELVQMPRNWLHVYAQQTRKLASNMKEATLQLQQSQSLDTHYIIEQQLMTYNVPCMILESQLHALLYPYAFSVSAKNVSEFMQLNPRPVKVNDDDEDKVDMQSVTIKKQSSSAKQTNKKKMAIGIVDHLVTNSDEIIRFDRNFLDAWNGASKKDDISDSVLNALYYIYIRKERLSYALNELTVQ